MINNVYCPVSPNRVDDNTVRAASLVMVILLVTGILFKSYVLVFLIGVDFALRAFTDGNFSFIRAIAKSITGYLRLNKKPIDAAPKKFAAGLGMIFSTLIGIFLYSGNFVLVYLFGAILVGCALLEGIFAFCVGCYLYSWVVIPFNKLQQIKN